MRGLPLIATPIRCHNKFRFVNPWFVDSSMS